MDNKKKIIIGASALAFILVAVVLFIILRKPVYEVAFISNNETIKTVEVKKNDLVSKPEDPTREGYTFEGWYLEDDFFDFDTKIKKDITLTAKWSVVVDNTNKKRVTVLFDSLGGTDVDAQVIEVNTKVVEPLKPTRDGYKFIEWQLNGEKFDFDTFVEENITLTAKWEKDTTEEELAKYTVTFNTDGGSSVKSQTIESGKTVKKPANPTREGYTFKGWYYNGVLYNFYTKVTSNITLTAKWEKDTTEEELVKYTVTFNSNGGSSVSTQTIESGKVASKPADPTKADHTFKGWYYNDSEYDFNSKVTSNIVLNAKWEKNAVEEEPTPVVKYTVTFNTDGGSSVSAQTIESGKTASKPADPTKADHTFKGWYYNGSEYDFSTKVTSNIVLDAKWEKVDVITYKIEDTLSTLGQVNLFVLKNGEKVDGIVQITTSLGTVKDIEIPKEGFTVQSSNIKSIDNVRVK